MKDFSEHKVMPHCLLSFPNCIQKKYFTYKVGLASASNYNDFAYWFPDKILQDTNQW